MGEERRVSIHALLAESDPYRLPQHKVIHSFNPRPPCGERPEALAPICRNLTFQSTPSLRRATVRGFIAFHRPGVSIHALLAESDLDMGIDISPKSVSIHALLAESDRCDCRTEKQMSGFNPRPPCGERRLGPTAASAMMGFNPRPPCGERLPQRYMLLINHASEALRQLHEDGTSHTVFSSSYLVVNLRFPMSYKNRRPPGNLM